MASLNQLIRPMSLKRSAQRVGRGQSSGRGKQSGRGGKGQTARAGHKIRPEWRDIIKRLPKRRGYGKNRGRTVLPRRETIVIPLTRLEAMFESGAEITMRSLKERGIIHARKRTPIKVVGGELTKKLLLKGIAVSKTARALIEKNGGLIS